MLLNKSRTIILALPIILSATAISGCSFTPVDKSDYYYVVNAADRNVANQLPIENFPSYEALPENTEYNIVQVSDSFISLNFKIPASYVETGYSNLQDSESGISSLGSYMSYHQNGNELIYIESGAPAAEWDSSKTVKIAQDAGYSSGIVTLPRLGAEAIVVVSGDEHQYAATISFMLENRLYRIRYIALDTSEANLADIITIADSIREL